jgi:hypothetical protein
VCALSRSEELLGVCPDYSCPPPTQLLGYPWGEIPDLTRAVRARNGYRPVEVSQFPPPGSVVRYDSVTEVGLTATDAEGRSEGCTTRVSVPPLIACGTVQMNVPPGTSTQRGIFTPDPDRITIAGTAFKMKGILQSRLQGRGSVTARLRKGGDKYGGTITFRGNRTKGALNNLAIVEPFSALNSTQALQVDLHVRDNVNPGGNVAYYTVYCQEEYGGQTG